MPKLHEMLIPGFFHPIARRLYWAAKFMMDQITSPGLSRSEYDHLDALKCTIAYNRFGGYCIPMSSRHRPAARKALAQDVYEPFTIQYINQHCGSGDIIHAGTYFGDFLPALEHSASSDARIWAFEPSEENYRCARITCILNGLARTELFNAGLGAADGTGALITTTREGWPLGSGSYLGQTIPDSKDNPETSNVPILTLDNVVPEERAVSIIHLDTEGYELHALEGALNTIRRNRPILILEKWTYDDIANTDWFSQHITAMGYERVHEIEGNQIYCI